MHCSCAKVLECPIVHVHQRFDKRHVAMCPFHLGAALSIAHSPADFQMVNIVHLMPCC